MAKKDFTNQAAKAGDTGSILDQVMPQEVDDAQEVLEAQEALRTQGKKGMKQQRINMAFTPSNLDFIRVMAGVSGKTMTQYVNAVMDAERERNGEVYQKAKALMNDL